MPPVLQTQPTMKTCRVCGLFSEHTKRASRCRSCNKKYLKKYYRENEKKIKKANAAWREKNILKKRATDEKRRLNRVAWVNKLKSNPCTDCGNTFPSVCMDWDHTDDNKTYDVSRLVNQGQAKSKILAEIRKCELVCSNCHRIRTQLRRLS